MTFIEWCIINEKDEFLDQMDEADLLDKIGALGKDALGLLGGRKPMWYRKLMADAQAERKARADVAMQQQLERPNTQRKRERRAMHRAELARRRQEDAPRSGPPRPPGCPPCPC